MNRNDARNQFRATLKRLDERYVGSVYSALKKQVKAFTDDLRAGGVEYAKGRLSMRFLNEWIEPVIRKIHRDAGVVLAQQTYSSLIKSKVQLKYRGFGHNEAWARDIQNYFDRFLLNKAVVPISETTRDNILRTLKRAIDEGWGVDETVRQLGDIDILRSRAKLIVRTETVRAANYGILLGADTYDYETEKEWLAVHDNRTRRRPRDAADHVVLDGQKRSNNERFSNGLLFPGDPTGPARETINCRCRVVIVPKRDRNGRLIPKPKLRVRPGGSLIETFSSLATGITLGAQIAELINDFE